MPRILRILNRFNLGGPTYNASYLAKYIGAEYETRLVGGHHDPHEKSSTHLLHDLEVPFEYVPHMNRAIDFGKDRKAYQWLCKEIAEFKPDIVHTHAAKAGAIGRLAASKMGVPAIVHTFHGHVFDGYFSPVKTEVFKQAERYLAKKSDAIVAISPEQKNDLTEKYGICSPEQTHTIRLGFDLSRFSQGQAGKRASFRSKWNLSEEVVVVSIVGRLTGIKNHLMFLQAMAKVLASSTVPIVGLVVGGGELDEILKSWCIERNMMYSPESASGILFTGWELEVDHVMAASDIVAMTSFNEGTPVSLIEAQAAGVSVVSTDVGGVKDIVQHGASGLLVESEDETAFAEGLSQLIASKDLRAKFGETGKMIAPSYSYKRLATDMRRLYESLL
ncbi:MAG: glycosyltransferase involved in cell wall biosynthesis [Flavobacteriales bacterium]|jgi:glycosyltransferase involved in cell wall biosynthesis